MHLFVHSFSITIVQICMRFLPINPVLIERASEECNCNLSKQLNNASLDSFCFCLHKLISDKIFFYFHFGLFVGVSSVNLTITVCSTSRCNCVVVKMDEGGI